MASDGGLVTFQPHSAEFGKLANAHAVLEAELKYYSSITSGVRRLFSILFSPTVSGRAFCYCVQQREWPTRLP